MLSRPSCLLPKKPDLTAMTAGKDIRGLIHALQSRDLATQIEAGKALGMLGSDAIDELIAALHTRNKVVKLGIIGALSEIRDIRAVQPLVETLRDENSEVRWQAAIALGEIGDEEVIDPLVHTLRDPDKYARYGSAFSLAKMGWKPADATDRAFFFIGMQEWNAVREIGKPAIPALTQLLHDRDAKVRMKAISLVGEIGDPEATPALIRSLADENREVRWRSVLASPKCGIPLLYLPRALSKRPQVTKNPYIAGFLNFILPGLGYGYLGKWWGPIIFQVDITLTVWLFKFGGEESTYLILFPLYLVLAVHAWYLTKKMPLDPP